MLNIAALSRRDEFNVGNVDFNPRTAATVRADASLQRWLQGAQHCP